LIKRKPPKTSDGIIIKKIQALKELKMTAMANVS